jgi:hypothetical protein
VQACDDELGGDGALMRLLSAVLLEQAQHRSARVAARRGANLSADEEDDVDPINRRELAAAGAAAGLSLGLGVACAPMSARDVDPALPEHSERLLAIIGAHADAHGAHEVCGTAGRELRLIAEHRRVATGDLQVALMGVEARWAVHAAWLCEDTGDYRGRDTLLRLVSNLRGEGLRAARRISSGRHNLARRCPVATSMWKVRDELWEIATPLLPCMSVTLGAAVRVWKTACASTRSCSCCSLGSRGSTCRGSLDVHRRLRTGG